MKDIKRLIEKRARMFADIRRFFATRGVAEVDTAVLSSAAVTDPQLHSLQTTDGLYLHTSPEFAMKKLLAEGSGDIYQLCHVFRGEEQGRKHRCEFMLLEWYRCGWNHLDLMKEVAALVTTLLPQYQDRPVIYSPYHHLFARYLHLDIDCPDADLRRFAFSHVPECRQWQLSRDDYLDLLFSHFIEPHLGQDAPEFVIAYPPSQAALARVIETDGKQVAARFELYMHGLELCNGFWELADVTEQRQRFEAENKARLASGLPVMPIDNDFLTALAKGLPDCAGVALGIDRLLMIDLNSRNIEDVIL